MEQRGKISNIQKKNLHYKKYFQKNIFDEDFLNEKDKALSPIVLSDVIPKNAIKKFKNKKNNAKTNFESNDENETRYGSNIVYIGPKIAKDDHDDEFRSILNEQIFKIISNE